MSRSGPSNSPGPADLVGEVLDGLLARADPVRAADMRAYMRDQFDFLGVPTPARRAASKELVRAARRAPEPEVVAVIDRVWARPEREFRYVGSDMARAASPRWGPDRLVDLRRWVTTDSWWDTVDSLAVSTGNLVRAHPGLAREMDRWIDDDDLWVARVALLHQLGWKDAVDQERLFRYCEQRAADTEFFIRKAIGWALRDHARTDPGAVRRFVDAHPGLSGLSRREALKHLGGS
ncbi:MAG: DNA alkylation repair protein [Microthrixaceae bacterium]